MGLAFYHFLEDLGRSTREMAKEQFLVVQEFARIGTGMFRIIRRLDLRPAEVMKQIGLIGVNSLPIITVSTAFAGIVITKEIAWHMNQALHTVQMVPGFTAQFILRELGIAIPALLMVAKVGAAITAEVGSMKVTEQIDALKLLQIDPISYLVFPRWVASIVSLACLTVIAIFITMSFAIHVAVTDYHFSTLEYLSMVRRFISPMDLVCSVVKAMTFGAVIPLISCAYGFRCRGGAEGVGSATTQSVVTSTLTVIVLDFILSYLFSLAL